MAGRRKCFTFLDHTADLRIRITGPTLEDLFRNAGLSLMEIMLGKRPRLKTSPQHLSLSGDDLPDLMVRWLGEILYLLDGENKVVMDIEINAISEMHLDAALHTVPLDPRTHQVITEIKAATYHQIQVAPTGNGWQATVIFDI
ncbi:MAG: archease [Deltaproteobacteria bacterium]|nr:archease [Deltaproteobacteria bacterium]